MKNNIAQKVTAFAMILALPYYIPLRSHTISI
jgi:hypothetical protein